MKSRLSIKNCLSIKRALLTVLFACVSIAVRADDPERVKAFYEAYMKNVLDSRETENAELCERYMTRRLIRKMKRAAAATDFDNIIRAQDMNETAVETLTVRPLDGGWHSVSYLWYKDDPKSRKEILVKTAGDPCRIVDIRLPEDPQSENK